MTNRDGGPLPEVTVTLEGMNVARAETTDADGRYSVRELAPGPYTLIFRVETNDRHGRPAPVVKQVTVADGVTETVNVVLVLYQPVDRGPCCKPYGAPPARRRVV